jgi:hypothetical protein
MLPREVVGEALRNVWTGVTRALPLAAGFVLLVGGIVVLDLRVLVGANNALEQWRGSGAAITIAYAEGAIDGAACEALAGTAGIANVGAVRTVKEGLPLPTLPLATPAYAEVTPGFARLIATTAGGARTPRAATPDSLARGGLLLSDSLATTLDRGPGTALTTANGMTTVAGAYATADDGRQRTFDYAALAQVPAVGLFDYCWAEVWPPDSTTASLLRAVVDANQPAVQVKLAQLNSRHGTELDALSLYRDRTSRYAPVAAAIAGLLLGFISIRLRRLELASALHAGVTRAALVAQLCVETASWLVVGVTISAPLIWLAANLGNPLPASALVPAIAAGLCSAAGATLAGALLSLRLTREAHLFTYFKNR